MLVCNAAAENNQSTKNTSEEENEVGVAERQIQELRWGCNRRMRNAVGLGGVRLGGEVRTESRQFEGSPHKGGMQNKANSIAHGV